MERFSSLVTKSRPWPVIGRTIFFTSDKNRPTRDEIYFIDFWRENLSMYRIKISPCGILVSFLLALAISLQRRVILWTVDSLVLIPGATCI